MTVNKDFKKLVRARMAKTGESYAAARAQMLEAPVPALDEYADLAGMTDEAVRNKTGHTWAEWAELLDAEGARDLSHKAIAARVRERWPAIGGWWAQSVTVGYERIRGIRVKGQMSSGDHAANRSRTYPVPVEVLFATFLEDLGWLESDATVRTTKPSRSVRLGWPDGTVVSAFFTDKGPQKSSVAVQHSKLSSSARREEEKVRWGQRLDRLGERLPS